MNLVLKIAAGIVLGFSILWVANVGFAVVAISSFSSAMSQLLSTKTTKVSYPQANVRPRKQIVGYKDKRIAGRPLDECLGPDKELNVDVLRCRNGYMKKIPIYSQ